VPQSEPLQTVTLPAAGLADHVVVAGYGRTGRAAVEVMKLTAVPFAVIESDHARFADCAGAASPSIWGDATLEPVLAAAGLARARLLLITVPDVVSIRTIIDRARQVNPGIDIIARAQLREQLDDLGKLAIYEVVQPEFEAGLEMVRQVLAHYGFSPADILRFSDAVHREAYQAFRGSRPVDGAKQAVADLRRAALELDIEWIEVAPSSPLADRTIGDVAFRTRSGASIVALRHAGKIEPNPGPDSRLRAGDTVGVLGTAEQRAAARDLIAGRSAP
jgi:CPA2 family monovalent cation:H+ antiporter-2